MKVGNIINSRYETLGVLGQGGMGIVFKVKRLDNGKEYALKMCTDSDANSLRRFKREVRIIRRIKHPNIMPVVHCALEIVAPYFVMPLASGSCEDKIDEYAQDHDQAINAFLQICDGVQAIHNAGCVHRDLKPANALILNGTVVVSDFGLVKEIDRATTVLTQTNVIVGTQDYRAPEQGVIGGSRDADCRTDIFQLGKLLYHFMAGQSPALMDFDALPQNIAIVIKKAIENLPRDRYQSVGELKDAINDCVRANDPNANPIKALYSLLAIAKDFIAQDQYNVDNIKNIIRLLTSAEMCDSANLHRFLDIFDEIPIRILNLFASSFSGEFIPVMKIYVKYIDQAIGGMPFSYADTVSSKMLSMFDHTKNATLKTLCVEATLLSSIRLNRFSAMETFDKMLTQIQDDCDALAVLDMLKRRNQEYKILCDRVQRIDLHPTIRRLRDELNSQ